MTQDLRVVMFVVIALLSIALSTAACSRSEAAGAVKPEPPATSAASVSSAGPTPPPQPATSEHAAATALGIDGMTCGGCAWQVEDKLSKLDGVRSVKVDLKEKCAAVQFDEGRVGPARMIAQLDEMGYEAADRGSGSVVALADGSLGCIAP